MMRALGLALLILLAAATAHRATVLVWGGGTHQGYGHPVAGDVVRDVLRRFPARAVDVPGAPPVSRGRMRLETSMALLVDHDDAEREYEYRSEAGSFDSDESITDVAARLGWTTVSMRDDWSRIFAPGGGGSLENRSTPFSSIKRYS